MGYLVSFPKQAVDPVEISRFDPSIEIALLDMDSELASRIQAHFTSSDHLELPRITESAFKCLRGDPDKDISWEVVISSTHGGGYRNTLLVFSTSKNNLVTGILPIEGSRSGYKKSCRSLSCSSGHQTSHSNTSPTARELLDDAHRFDVPPDSVPKPIFDATLEISRTIDMMRGKGTFDSELKLIETVMEKLKKPAPFHHIEVISRLSTANQIFAVHPTAEIRLHGYPSRLGEFSSHWELAKAEGRDPNDWMGMHYLLPCSECHGTGVEQSR